MKSPMTTLCYIKRNDSYLMMHRIKKKHDVNAGKWIGVGGHFETGESPEDLSSSGSEGRDRAYTSFVEISWDRYIFTGRFRDRIYVSLHCG